MTPWTSFYDLMSPDLPGCPLLVQTNALRQSAIAFCEQSMAWKYTHPNISILVGTAEYAFVPPLGAVVHTVTYAEFEGDEISAITAEPDIPIFDWRNQTGTPKYIVGGPTDLTVIPTPDVAGTLKLTVILKPTPTADGVDDNIYKEYREAVIHGALARLMLSPKKQYTDAALANYHMQQFTIKTASAGIRAARNYTRAPLQTTIMRRR